MNQRGTRLVIKNKQGEGGRGRERENQGILTMKLYTFRVFFHIGPRGGTFPPPSKFLGYIHDQAAHVHDF